MPRIQCGTNAADLVRRRSWPAKALASRPCARSRPARTRSRIIDPSNSLNTDNMPNSILPDGVRVSRAPARAGRGRYQRARTSFSSPTRSDRDRPRRHTIQAATRSNSRRLTPLSRHPMQAACRGPCRPIRLRRDADCAMSVTGWHGANIDGETGIRRHWAASVGIDQISTKNRRSSLR